MKRHGYFWVLAYIIFHTVSCNGQIESNHHASLLKIDRKLVNNPDPNFNSYIENLSWKDSLDHWDESMVHAIIDSSHYNEFQANVMIPVMVHRLQSVSQRDTLWFWEPFRKYIMHSPSLSDTKYDQFLLNSIDPDTLSTKIKMQIFHYWVADDAVLRALVIRQCKRLRLGKPPSIDIPLDWLNDYQKSLIEYSKMQKDIAIGLLFSQISMLSQPELQYEHALPYTLLTYGSKASHKSLAIVLDSTAFRTFSHAGQRHLLNHVTQRAKLDFTEYEKSDLIKYINTESVYKGVMKDFASQIAFITSRITGEDWKKCLIRIGFTVDEKENTILPIRLEKKRK